MSKKSQRLILTIITLLLISFLALPLGFAWETPKPAMIIKGDQDANGLQFNNPTAVAFGRDGDIFVTDTLNAIVQVFDRDGNFKFYLGEPGMGGGQFAIPWGIATDKDGKVYVTDIAQHRIHIFDHNGRFLAMFGGAGNGEGKFNLPFDIFIDKWDVLNILDSGNGLIQRIKKAFDSQVGGIGKSNGSFDSPAAFIGDDGGRYYVVDTGNMRIQTIGADGTFLHKFGMAGSTDGSFTRPQGIARDAFDHLYISDSDSQSVRISVFGLDGRFLYKWGEIGTEPGKFLDVGRITFDGGGRFFVVDTGNNRIQVFENVETTTAPCFYCHRSVEAKNGGESVHKPFQEQKCQACHNNHSSTSSPADLYVAQGAKLCAECHDFNEEKFYLTHELYPVSRTSCTECHDPHGSPNPKLLRRHAKTKKTVIPCASCHDVLTDDTVKLKETRQRLCYICHNTKLGNVHYETFRDEQKDCLECHVRHSGPVKDNLKSFGEALCATADCHSSKKLLHQHISDVYAPEDMDVPSSLPLDKSGKITCLTCHGGHATPNKEYLRVAKENLCLLCHRKKSRKMEKLEVLEVVNTKAFPVGTEKVAPATENEEDSNLYVPGNEPE